MDGARYSSVAVVLHWAIALLILGQLAGGFYMHNLPNTSPVKFDLYQLHKSFGLSIFTLALVRLGWRLGHRPPALPAAMPNWQKLVARATHWAFYALMIVTPLVGLSIVSVSPRDIPTEWFGLFHVPHLPLNELVADRGAAEDGFEELHELLAYAILGLLGLHVAAALKHQFINRDGVFSSMAPSQGLQWIGVVVILALLGGAGVTYLTTKSAPVTTSVRETQAQPSTLAAEDAPSTSDATPPQEAPTENASPPPTLSQPQHDPTPSRWSVNRSASALRFIGEENGRSFEGSFTNFDADIRFDPHDLDASSVKVTVYTASAATGDELRDATMPGGEWFDVKDYPTATFVTKDIAQTGAGSYEATGTLTIKEFSREIVLPFVLEINGDMATASGEVDLIRTNYGLGTADTWLSEEGVALKARVEFEITASKAN